MLTEERFFGKSKAGRDCMLYTFSNQNGMTMSVTDFGATLYALHVPAAGKLVDVVLGYDDPAGYEGPSRTYFGATVGRNANRIGNARFCFHGKEIRLDANDGKNTLHGGANGYSFRVWNTEKIEGNSITFSLVSPDGDQGFPGKLEISVTYTLTEENEVMIRYYGVSDQDTVINLTHHSFFNLNGHDSGSAMNHTVWLDADHYTPTDEELIPTGEIAPVEGTPMDFRVKKPVGQDISQDFDALHIGRGYDHNWCLNNQGSFAKVAEATGDISGITMEVYTDMPAIQMYSGNYLKNEKGKHGVVYGYRQSLCFEPQYYPDAPNHEGFFAGFYRAGQVYDTRTIYKFI